jgi:phage tail-like protein
MPIPASKRGYMPGKFGVDIGGNFAGWVMSAEGGHPSSDVVTEKLGPDNIQKKHVAGVKYDDISISCGTGMSKQFWNWVKDSIDHKYSRKDGAIITADYDFREMTRMNFFHALISEVALPACDAASKDAAKMTVKFSPETTRVQTPMGGAKVTGQQNQAIQKKWLPANFRLDIKGFEQACSRINKIEAITIKQKNAENPVGQMRDYEREPAYLEFGNLVITLAESHADAFYKWMQNFVVDGKNGEDMEKTATLEYLTPNLRETLLKLTFYNLGIFKLTPDKSEAGAEGIRRVKVEMYCEKIQLDYTAAWM